MKNFPEEYAACDNRFPDECAKSVQWFWDRTESLPELCEKIYPAGKDQEIELWAKEIETLQIPWRMFFFPGKETICFPLPFHSYFPPYCFPEKIPTSETSLKLCLAYLLENFEYILGVQTKNPLLPDFMQALLFKISLNESKNLIEKKAESENFRQAWNTYALHRFASEEIIDANILNEMHETAKIFAKTPDQKALIALHHAGFLKGFNYTETAFASLEEQKREIFSPIARAYFDAARIEAFSGLPDRYRFDRNSAELVQTTQSTLKQLEKFKDPFAEASLLEASATIARKQGNFSESLRCLAKAENLYEQMEMIESKAQAQVQKAEIYQQWAQEQNPAFYAQALKNYASALKVFTAENFPAIHSDIELQLAIIYSEKPEEPGKNVMLRSLAIQSFKNALRYCDPDLFPARYAGICHNYACALLKFGREIRRDETEKAEQLIDEALSRRNPEKYPLERAFSLLTKIEILRIRFFEKSDESLRKEIEQRIEEVESLTNHPEIKTELKLLRQDLNQTSKKNNA